MTFAMAAGGTGGHVVPALAVARELERRGHRPVFVGTKNGFEARLVPAAGFEIEWIEIGAWNRVSLMQRLRTAAMLPESLLRSARILRRERAAVVFSMGGYVAAPVVLAALASGIPVVAMEPNALPGMVNRKTARWLDTVLVAFEETRALLPGRCVVSGVPVREGFFRLGPSPVNGQPLEVLITGGSRGSRTLNRAFRDSLTLFAAKGAPPVRFRHQCGTDDLADLQKALANSGLPGSVEAFIADMPEAFGQAAIVVGRSGANAVAELAAAGRPSILVPFPFAADDHQTRNAQAMVQAGAARIIADAEMNGRRLFEEIRLLTADPARLAAMGEAAKRLAKPDAAAAAADALMEAAGRRWRTTI
jgi:UDP-N-acetylglucosamine--N-acetylmuramyl-(pentapeptide) pyrophosphoryl-undecaprenol N-acetylglucosamine transferase